MNTFLPFPNYRASAAVLDRERLGKQRIEVVQLLDTIVNGKKAWANHPCTLMWKPWINALIEYGQACCDEWTYRGYDDNQWGVMLLYTQEGETPIPPWLGSPKLHKSHRANLTRKDAVHYGQYWKEEPQDEYFWPKAYYLWNLYEVQPCQ